MLGDIAPRILGTWSTMYEFCLLFTGIFQETFWGLYSCLYAFVLFKNIKIKRYFWEPYIEWYWSNTSCDSLSWLFLTS